MKILLVCTSGISAGILLKKMRAYAEELNSGVEILAKGVEEYQDYFQGFDLILLGPQISYKRNEIEKQFGKPVLVISPSDYAVGNVKNIFEQVRVALPPHIDCAKKSVD